MMKFSPHSFLDTERSLEAEVWKESSTLVFTADPRFFCILRQSNSFEHDELIIRSPWEPQPTRPRKICFPYCRPRWHRHATSIPIKPFPLWNRRIGGRERHVESTKHFSAFFSLVYDTTLRYFCTESFHKHSKREVNWRRNRKNQRTWGKEKW